jgi:lysophospholipase L1-like esterase
MHPAQLLFSTLLTLILSISFVESSILHVSPRKVQAPLMQNPFTQNEIPLRILPLGNSITWGYGSTSGNGYRQPLLSLLSPQTNVTYIGSEHSGNMSNNANEGHPGAIIYDIAIYSRRSLGFQPNVILLMAGTNDIWANIKVDEAPDRLGTLIDLCVQACPEAVVLVAQLTPIGNPEIQVRVDTFNAEIPSLVGQRRLQGKKVAVVDMESYVAVEMLMDGLHPNDEGYKGMSTAWYHGIRKAAEMGWIHQPLDVGNLKVTSKPLGPVEESRDD